MIKPELKRLSWRNPLHWLATSLAPVSHPRRLALGGPWRLSPSIGWSVGVAALGLWRFAIGGLHRRSLDL